MIRALIVDDEPLIRQALRSNLVSEPDVQVAGECGDGDAAIAAIRSLNPDVVFLDVQMPGTDGFGVVEGIGPAHMPLVVFVTAYDEYAVRAFEVHAVDYLLKPFDAERVQRAVAQVRLRLREKGTGDFARRLENVLAIVERQTQWPERLPVRSGQKIELVAVNEIEWVEAESNYVLIHTRGRTHILRETLGSFEKRLNPAKFARIHRSYVVNVSRIKELRPLFHGEYEIVLADGARISSGRTYADVLQRLLR